MQLVLFLYNGRKTVVVLYGKNYITVLVLGLANSASQVKTCITVELYDDVFDDDDMILT